MEFHSETTLLTDRKKVSAIMVEQDKWTVTIEMYEQVFEIPLSGHDTCEPGKLPTHGSVAIDHETGDSSCRCPECAKNFVLFQGIEIQGWIDKTNILNVE